MSLFNRIFSRGRLYGELSDEIREHLNEKMDELVASGMPRKEAAYAARREFGNLTLTEEGGRAVWRWPSLEDFFMDVRYALRTLRKSLGFTTVVVLTLTLGIGANTAIFSIVNSVLLRPLPYRNASRLVWVSNDIPRQHASLVMESDYFGWRELNHAFEDLAAYWPGETLTLTGGNEPEQIQAGHVTYNFLDVLGIVPRLGRSFRAEEDLPGVPHVVLLTDSLWHRRFSADPAIVGRVVALDGEPYTVLGVLPPSFEFLDNSRADVLVPVGLQPIEVARAVKSNVRDMINKPMHLVNVVARLRPGIAPFLAAGDIDAVNQQLWSTYPAPFAKMLNGARAQVVPLQERLVGKVRPALLVLLGAVGFVLLIACVNVANLQLARAVAREKDIAIRGALGAGRWRLFQQLLTENTLLAVAGGACGLFFAAWLITLLRIWGPADIPHLSSAHVDPRVLLFALALSLATGILFGLSPALSVFRIPVLESLRKSGAREGASVKVRRPHNVLMVAEVAVALVLFVGAGLLIRSFVQLISIPPGFDAQGVLTARLSLPLVVYQKPRQRMAFYRQLDQRLATLPGVVSAGLATVLPLQGTNSSAAGEIEGRAPGNFAEGPSADIAHVTPGYFSALHIPLLQGRLLEARDIQDMSSSVLVVNQAFTRRYFPDEDALGKRMRLGTDAWSTIVGVVGDSKQAGLAAAVQPEVFLPLGDWSYAKIDLVLRSQRDPITLVQAVRAAVRELDLNLPLFDIAPMDSLLAREVSLQRFNAALLSAFALFALLLAAVGIYGVIAYAVGQRTHEIGVRMALGAAPENVQQMILARGLALAFTGLSLGLFASLALTRFMRTLLYGVQPTDVVTFVIVTLTLLAVVFVACWLPARRATRVDPLIALRYE
jgi:putative ABC transport system permease protein